MNCYGHHYDQDGDPPIWENDDEPFDDADPMDRFSRMFSNSRELLGGLLASLATLTNPSRGEPFDLARYAKGLCELGDALRWACSDVLSDTDGSFDTDTDWTKEAESLGRLASDLEYLVAEGRRHLAQISEPEAVLACNLREGISEASTALLSLKLLAGDEGCFSI
jgi:hypothetical protein